MRITPILLLSFSLFAPVSAANEIELAPGLWEISSEETKDVSQNGRLNSQAPVTESEKRCLDETSAWLIPAEYAESFTSRGCSQNSFLATPINFEGSWTCRVDGLDLTITMKGEASLTGDSYGTLMTVTGRNENQSVNVKNTVNAKRLGTCDAPLDGFGLLQ